MLLEFNAKISPLLLLSFSFIFSISTVSNALKPQRRFTISGLQPSTLYQLRMEAHNVAGVSQAEFTFVTLTKDGEQPPPEIVQRGQRGSNVFYGNVNLLIPSIATLSGMICTIALVVMCYRHSKYWNCLPKEGCVPMHASVHGKGRCHVAANAWVGHSLPLAKQNKHNTANKSTNEWANKPANVWMNYHYSRNTLVLLSVYLRLGECSRQEEKAGQRAGVETEVTNKTV